MCTKKFSSKTLLLRHSKDHLESSEQVSDDETFLEPKKTSVDKTMIQPKQIYRDNSTVQLGSRVQCRRCGLRLPKEASARKDHIKNHALNDGVQICLHRINFPEKRKRDDLGFEEAAEARRRNRMRQDERSHEEKKQGECSNGAAETHGRNEIRLDERLYKERRREEFDFKRVAGSHRENEAVQLERFHEERKQEELSRGGLKLESHRRNRKRLKVRFRFQRVQRSEQFSPEEDTRLSVKSPRMSHIRNHVVNKDTRSSVRESKEEPKGEEVIDLHDYCLKCKRKISDIMWRVHMEHHALNDKVCVSLSRVIAPRTP